MHASTQRKVRARKGKEGQHRQKKTRPKLSKGLLLGAAETKQ